MSEFEPKLPQDPKEIEIGALAMIETAEQPTEICQLGVESDINYLLPNLADAQDALNDVLNQFAQHSGKPDNIAMVRRGAQYVASFSNSHRGYSAGRQIYLRDHDHYLNNSYERHIIPAAEALKKRQTANHNVEANLEALNGSDDYAHQARFQIFKSIIYDCAPHQLTDHKKQTEISAATTLATIIATENSDIKQQIIQEAKRGGFDRFLAYNLLKIGDNDITNNDPIVDKIHQLLELVRATWQVQGAEIGQFESYLKALETFDNWPTDCRYVVIELRQALIKRFEDNIEQISQTLAEENIVASADPESAFAESYMELDERLSLGTKVQKRRKQQPAPLTAVNEQDTTPETKNFKNYNTVMCHLTDRGGTTDDVDKYIEKLTKDMGQNNNGKFHEDVLSLKKYLEHLTMPPPHGIKAIATCRYVWFDGRRHAMYQAKPKDITGVRTSGISGNIRAFFIIIKAPDDESNPGTLGIIDIVDKKDAERKLNKIRQQSARLAKKFQHG